MYTELIKELKEQKVNLVAVSKTKSEQKIKEIYDQGQRIFGENRARELEQKAENLPHDIEWHMIGHLQKNKVKYIAGIVSLIHSVDNEKLLNTINKEAEKNNRKISYLLQIKIAEEESKYGLSENDAFGLAKKIVNKKFPNTICKGVMGMATFTEDQEKIRREFKRLKKVFDQLSAEYFQQNHDFDTISMGMSGDYKIAIEEGSTMVRIGSLIFGPREN